MHKKFTPDEVNALLKHDPETGQFTWLPRKGRRQWNAANAGKVAGSIQCRHRIESGYIVISIHGWPYSAHRLAWLVSYGNWPEGDIDHKDRDGTNNRIDNLRLASHSQNRWNQKRPRHNTSGFKGVTWNKKRNRWQASIGFNGRTLYLGLHESPEAAHAAYSRAAHERFGEYARAG